MFTTRQRGFTIVELLVVIVVVGILATLGVAGYSGVKARAERTKTVATVKDFGSALKSYKAAYGRYPANSPACLGNNYIDHTNDIIHDCRWGTRPVSVNDAFNNELSRVARPSNRPAQKPIANGTAAVDGMYYLNDPLGKLDGKDQPTWIVYVVPDKKCGIDVPLMSARYPELTSKSNDAVSENWGNGGLCWYPLR